MGHNHSHTKTLCAFSRNVPEFTLPSTLCFFILQTHKCRPNEPMSSITYVQRVSNWLSVVTWHIRLASFAQKLSHVIDILLAFWSSCNNVISYNNRGVSISSYELFTPSHCLHLILNGILLGFMYFTYLFKRYGSHLHTKFLRCAT